MSSKLNKLKKVLIGKPLRNDAIKDQKLSVTWGVPILSSDAISSVAYAGQEMLLTLGAAGALGAAALSFHLVGYLSMIIVGLLLILILSYKQTIDAYPNGGGAYIVSKTNIGVTAGTMAGAALSVGYILTVAVSVSAGVQAITSAFPVLESVRLYLALGLIALLMLGNLRGVRESSRLFGLPAYAFIFCILALIVTGIFKGLTGQVHLQPAAPNPNTLPLGIYVFLILRAFSNGCSALLGIEAVSNTVPQMKDPAQKHAKQTLYILGAIVLVLFLGTSLLLRYYPIMPSVTDSLLVLMAQQIFGVGYMYYAVAFTTFIILILASNTAYSGFPLLLNVIAKDGYAPRQLSYRGDRLSYSNGILLLSAAAGVLVLVFDADVTKLIGLYAIGVFLSFTLSQTGMCLHWMRTKEKGWKHKATINIIGAVLTGLVVISIGITKFRQGAWIVVLIVPIMVYVMSRVKRHYLSVRKQLRICPEDYANFDVDNDTYDIRVIVPISGVNKASVRALRYANTQSRNVTAFFVAIDDESAQEIKEKYAALHTEIPLVIKYSSVRKVVDPLIEYIDSLDLNHKAGEITEVILSEFRVKKFWHRVLHNSTINYIEKDLRKHKHIVVSIMPLQLKDDNVVMSTDYCEIKK